MDCRINKPRKEFFVGTRNTGRYCRECWRKRQLSRRRKAINLSNGIKNIKMGKSRAYFSSVVKSMAKQLHKMGLQDRAETVVKLRNSGKTLQYIGDRMNISRERVRQIEKKYKSEEE